MTIISLSDELKILTDIIMVLAIRQCNILNNKRARSNVLPCSIDY